MSAFALSEPAALPGYRIRIADGNHLGATEHRLKPLPGQSIAVLDPEQKLVTDVFLCEDDHAQERSLLPDLLETVQTRDVWIADRNFCTLATLMGIAQRQAYFVIRVHQNLPWKAVEPLKPVGSSATGEIFEQPVTITYEGISLTLRHIVVKLFVPTRHGDSEVAIFTNLPVTVALAAKIAELYRDRWSVEKLFQVITDVFSCELNTLGYPRATLFVFCIALRGLQHFDHRQSGAQSRSRYR